MIRRGSVTRLVERHYFIWEMGMALLAAVYLVLAIYDDERPGRVPYALILSFSVVFLLEFLVRWWDAPSRWRYFRRHWLDLVSAAPLIGGLRILRLLRLVRFFRFAAGVRVLATGERFRESSAGSLWFVMPTVVILWTSSACAIWVLEHGQNPNIKNFGDALYWAFITATTVGYGDVSPVTAGGRILSGLLVFVAIGMIGVTSSRLTALWLDEAGQDQQVVSELQLLRQEVAAQREMLARLCVTLDTDHAPHGDESDSGTSVTCSPTTLSPMATARQMQPPSQREGR